MYSAHQTALETKHANLDRRISDEMHRPLPDQTTRADLTKQKRRVKEELLAQ